MSTVNYFVIESNISLYLDRLNRDLDQQTRDTVLKLLLDEEAKVGRAREHLERAEQRILEGRERLIRQRARIAEFPIGHPSLDGEEMLVDTLERTQALLEAHCERLRQAFEHFRL